ncbi:MAG: hypothetical protein EHM89_05125 [Acidobacteria bacterium]|nr:MAG: hypothetical protein EHM89_05125 [Acidobacteriota bacterium]
MNVRSAWSATAWYLAATIILTWPTAAGLARDIPWDLGDSLMVCWILGWDADHVLRFLSGDWSAFRGFWTANIFGHEPLTLAYGEHLIALALPIVPIYALTKNLILCYNLLFLASFVLSGLGMYLFVRDVTGSMRGAFIAGLIFAFALFRIGHYSHLQLLSSQWMPFVLLGFHRYFEHRHLLSLVGAAVALVAQNLSCGYYLLYFSPFVVAYVLFEIGRRDLWRDRRMWIALSVAVLGVSAITVPFLLPYLELRRLGSPARPIWEVIRFSADVYSYATAHSFHPLYAERIRVFPKPEGDLFPGLVPLLLAGLALFVHLRTLAANSLRLPRAPSTWGVQLAILAFCVGSALIVIVLLTGGFSTILGDDRLQVRRISRPLAVALLGLGFWAWRSPRVRSFLRGAPRSTTVFLVVALAGCFLLSLGPLPHVMGKPLADQGPYRLLYDHVPGFDGVRAPARFGMLFALFLAVLASFGVRVIEQRVRRASLITIPLAFLFFYEATAAPILMNVTSDATGLARPPGRMVPGPETLGIYRAVNELPNEVVVAEFPFGDPSYELRYMYYSTTHWRRLLNGYSGSFPDSHIKAREVLGALPNRRHEEAWALLTSERVTHAVVHEGAFVGDAGARLSTWLESRGAREIAVAGQDRLFELRPNPTRGP